MAYSLKRMLNGRNRHRMRLLSAVRGYPALNEVNTHSLAVRHYQPSKPPRSWLVLGSEPSFPSPISLLGKIL
jgi:hypothetical protein